MAKPVVMLGDINVDMVFKQVETEGQPPFNLEVRGGGTVGNTAVALAHLGTPVEFLGTVGDGGYGRFLRRDLINEGVGVTHVQVNQNASSSAIIFVVDPAGDIQYNRTAWPLDMDNQAMRLGIDDIDVNLITEAAWIHTSGTSFLFESFSDGALFCLERARAAGVPISLDINIRKQWLNDTFWIALPRAIELADVVLCSATDDLPLVEPDVPFEEAASRISGGARICVARMGAEGSYAISPEEKVRVGAFAVNVLDTVGAGDTYNAGFIAARLEGLSLEDSLRWGGAVAAITISRTGTRNSPTREEVETLLTKGII